MSSGNALIWQFCDDFVLPNVNISSLVKSPSNHYQFKIYCNSCSSNLHIDLVPESVSKSVTNVLVQTSNNISTPIFRKTAKAMLSKSIQDDATSNIVTTPIKSKNSPRKYKLQSKGDLTVQQNGHNMHKNDKNMKTHLSLKDDSSRPHKKKHKHRRYSLENLSRNPSGSKKTEIREDKEIQTLRVKKDERESRVCKRRVDKATDPLNYATNLVSNNSQVCFILSRGATPFEVSNNADSVIKLEGSFIKSRQRIKREARPSPERYAGEQTVCTSLKAEISKESIPKKGLVNGLSYFFKKKKLFAKQASYVEPENDKSGNHNGDTRSNIVKTCDGMCHLEEKNYEEKIRKNHQNRPSSADSKYVRRVEMESIDVKTNIGDLKRKPKKHNPSINSEPAQRQKLKVLKEETSGLFKEGKRSSQKETNDLQPNKNKKDQKQQCSRNSLHIRKSFSSAQVNTETKENVCPKKKIEETDSRIRSKPRKKRRSQSLFTTASETNKNANERIANVFMCELKEKVDAQKQKIGGLNRSRQMIDDRQSRKDDPKVKHKSKREHHCHHIDGLETPVILDEKPVKHKAGDKQKSAKSHHIKTDGNEQENVKNAHHGNYRVAVDDKESRKRSGKVSKSALDASRRSSSAVQTAPSPRRRAVVDKSNKSQTGFSLLDHFENAFNISYLYDEKTKAYNITKDQMEQFVNQIKTSSHSKSHKHKKSSKEKTTKEKTSRKEVSFSKLNLCPLTKCYEPPVPFYTWDLKPRKRVFDQKSAFSEVVTEKEKYKYFSNDKHRTARNFIFQENIVESSKKALLNEKGEIEFTVEGVEPPKRIRLQEIRNSDGMGNNSKQMRVSVLAGLEIKPNSVGVEDSDAVKLKNATIGKDNLKKSFSDSESATTINKGVSKLTLKCAENKLSKTSVSHKYSSSFGNKLNVPSSPVSRNESKNSILSNEPKASCKTSVQSRSTNLLKSKLGYVPKIKTSSSDGFNNDEDCDRRKNLKKTRLSSTEKLDKEYLANLGHEVMNMMHKYLGKQSSGKKEEAEITKPGFSAVGEDFFMQVKTCIESRLKPLEEEPPTFNALVKTVPSKIYTKTNLKSDLGRSLSKSEVDAKVEKYLKAIDEKSVSITKRKTSKKEDKTPIKSEGVRARMSQYVNKLNLQRKPNSRDSSRSSVRDGSVKGTASCSSRDSSRRSVGSKKSTGEVSLDNPPKSTSNSASTISNKPNQNATKTKDSKRMSSLENATPTVLLYDSLLEESSIDNIISEKLDLLPKIAEESASQNSVQPLHENPPLQTKLKTESAPIAKKDAVQIKQSTGDDKKPQSQLPKKELHEKLKKIACDMSEKVMQAFQLNIDASPNVCALGDLSSDSKASHISSLSPKLKKRNVTGKCTFIKKNIAKIGGSEKCSSNGSSIADCTTKKYVNTRKFGKDAKIDPKKGVTDESRPEIDDIIQLTNLLKDNTSNDNSLEKANLLERIISKNIANILKQKEEDVDAKAKIKKGKGTKSLVKRQRTFNVKKPPPNKKMEILSKLEALMGDDDSLLLIESKLDKLLSKENASRSEGEAEEKSRTSTIPIVPMEKTVAFNRKEDPRKGYKSDTSSVCSRKLTKTTKEVKRKTPSPIRGGIETVANSDKICKESPTEEFAISKRVSKIPRYTQLCAKSIISKSALSSVSSALPRETGVVNILEAVFDKTSSKIISKDGNSSQIPRLSDLDRSTTSVLTSNADKTINPQLSNLEKRKRYAESLRSKNLLTKSEDDKFPNLQSPLLCPYKILYVTSEGPFLNPYDPLTKYIINFDELSISKKTDDSDVNSLRIITLDKKFKEDPSSGTKLTKFPTEPVIKLPSSNVDQTMEKQLNGSESVRLENCDEVGPVLDDVNCGRIFRRDFTHSSSISLSSKGSKLSQNIDYCQTSASSTSLVSIKAFDKITTCAPRFNRLQDTSSCGEVVKRRRFVKKKLKRDYRINTKNFLGENVKNEDVEHLKISKHLRKKRSKFLFRKVESCGQVAKKWNSDEEVTYFEPPKLCRRSSLLLHQNCFYKGDFGYRQVFPKPNPNGKKVCFKDTRALIYHNFKKTLTSIRLLRQKRKENPHRLFPKIFKSGVSLKMRNKQRRLCNCMSNSTFSSSEDYEEPETKTTFKNPYSRNDYDSDGCYKIFAYNSLVEVNCTNKIISTINKSNSFTSLKSLRCDFESGYETNPSKNANSWRKYRSEDVNILKRFTDFSNFEFPYKRYPTFCVCPLATNYKRSRQSTWNRNESRQSDSGNFSAVNQESSIPSRKCKLKKNCNCDKEVSAKPTKVCFQPCLVDTSTSTYYYPNCEAPQIMPECHFCLKYQKRNYKRNKQSHACANENCPQKIHKRSGSYSTSDGNSSCADDDSSNYDKPLQSRNEKTTCTNETCRYRSLPTTKIVSRDKVCDDETCDAECLNPNRSHRSHQLPAYEEADSSTICCVPRCVSNKLKDISALGVPKTCCSLAPKQPEKETKLCKEDAQETDLRQDGRYKQLSDFTEMRRVLLCKDDNHKKCTRQTCPNYTKMFDDSSPKLKILDDEYNVKTDNGAKSSTPKLEATTHTNLTRRKSLRVACISTCNLDLEEDWDEPDPPKKNLNDMSKESLMELIKQQFRESIKDIILEGYKENAARQVPEEVQKDDVQETSCSCIKEPEAETSDGSEKRATPEVEFSKTVATSQVLSSNTTLSKVSDSFSNTDSNDGTVLTLQASQEESSASSMVKSPSLQSVNSSNLRKVKANSNLHAKHFNNLSEDSSRKLNNQVRDSVRIESVDDEPLVKNSDYLSCDCWDFQKLSKQTLLKLKEKIDNCVNNLLESSNENNSSQRSTANSSGKHLHGESSKRLDSSSSLHNYLRLSSESIIDDSPKHISKTSKFVSVNTSYGDPVIRSKGPCRKARYLSEDSTKPSTLPQSLIEEHLKQEVSRDLNQSRPHHLSEAIDYSKDSPSKEYENVPSSATQKSASTEQFCTDCACFRMYEETKSSSKPSPLKEVAKKSPNGSRKALTSLKEVINTTFTVMLNASKEALDMSSKEAHNQLMQSLSELSSNQDLAKKNSTKIKVNVGCCCKRTKNRSKESNTKSKEIPELPLEADNSKTSSTNENCVPAIICKEIETYETAAEGCIVGIQLKEAQTQCDCYVEEKLASNTSLDEVKNNTNLTKTGEVALAAGGNVQTAEFYKFVVSGTEKYEFESNAQETGTSCDATELESRLDVLEAPATDVETLKSAEGIETKDTVVVITSKPTSEILTSNLTNLANESNVQNNCVPAIIRKETELYETAIEGCIVGAQLKEVQTHCDCYIEEKLAPNISLDEVKNGTNLLQPGEVALAAGNNVQTSAFYKYVDCGTEKCEFESNVQETGTSCNAMEVDAPEGPATDVETPKSPEEIETNDTVVAIPSEPSTKILTSKSFEKSKQNYKDSIVPLVELIENKSNDILQTPKNYLTIPEEEIEITPLPLKNLRRSLDVAFNSSLFSMMSSLKDSSALRKNVNSFLNKIFDEDKDTLLQIDVEEDESTAQKKTRLLNLAVDQTFLDELLVDPGENPFDEPLDVLSKVAIVMAVNNQNQGNSSKTCRVMSNKLLLDMAKMSLEALIQLYKKFFPRRNINVSFKTLVEELHKLNISNKNLDRSMTKSQIEIVNLLSKADSLSSGKFVRLPCHCKEEKGGEGGKGKFVVIPWHCKEGKGGESGKEGESGKGGKSGKGGEGGKGGEVGKRSEGVKGGKEGKGSEERKGGEGRKKLEDTIFSRKSIVAAKDSMAKLPIKAVNKKSITPLNKSTTKLKDEEIELNEESAKALRELRGKLTDKEMFEKVLDSYERLENIVERLSQDEDFFRDQLRLVKSKESIDSMFSLDSRQAKDKFISDSSKALLKKTPTDFNVLDKFIKESPPVQVKQGRKQKDTLDRLMLSDESIDKSVSPSKPTSKSSRLPSISKDDSRKLSKEQPKKKSMLSQEGVKNEQKVKKGYRNPLNRLFHRDSVKEIVAPREEDNFRKESKDLSFISDDSGQRQSESSSLSISDESVDRVTLKAAFKKPLNKSDAFQDASTIPHSEYHHMKDLGISPSEIGKCFLRGFRSDNITLSGQICLDARTGKPMTNAQLLQQTESLMDFSERDTPLDFLLALGFSIDEASNAIKDEDVKNRLAAAINEARVWINRISSVQGTLLYLIAYKAKPRIMRYYLQLVEAIINERIRNVVKLDGFLKVLEKVEDGDLAMITIIGTDKLQDEDNDEKVVRRQLREIFLNIYTTAEQESKANNETLTKNQIALLRILAAKYRAGLHQHLELIAKYIGQKLLNTEIQLEAAMIYLSRLDTDFVNILEFERYCGIDCHRDMQ